MSAKVVKLPEESIDAMVVEPYLKSSLPPDSIIEKLVVVKAFEPIPIVASERVGPVPNTNAPEPVSPVTAAAKFEEDGVAKNVATSWKPRLI